VAEIWFRIAEWILIVAALQAIATASKALAMHILAYISAGLVSIYAFHLADLAIGRAEARIKTFRVAARLGAVALVAAFQYLVIVAVNGAVFAALSAAKSP